MTDPIAVLARAAERAAADPGLAVDPVAAVHTRIERRRRRRARRALATAAVVAVLVATVAVVVAGPGDDRDAVVVAPTLVPEPSDEAVPPSPLNPRSHVAIAAVGDEVVVWGGTDMARTPVSDGAAYDRTTGEWRTVAPSPLDARPEEIGGAVPVAAPVAGGVVVARGRDVARWDQASDTWSVLDEAPAIVTDLVAVGPERLFSMSSRAVLDVAAGRWLEPVSGPPVDLQRTAQTWTGTEVLVVGATPAGDPHVLAFDPATLEWGELAQPSSPLFGAPGVAASWDGERVIVTDYEMQAAAYDPATGTWEELPDVPARFAEHHPSNASAGGATATAMARTLAVLDPHRRTWTPLPAPNPSDGGGPPGQWLVPVGDDTVATWVDDAGPNQPDLVLFDPTTLPARDRRRQVGRASVELDADEHVAGSVLDRGTPTTPGSLTVDVLDPGGRHCRLTSALGGPSGGSPPVAGRERLPVDDPTGRRDDVLWSRDETGTRWETEIEDGDVFVIDCDDPFVARRLAGTLRLG